MRHYYYRLLKRLNKILGEERKLDASNHLQVHQSMVKFWEVVSARRRGLKGGAAGRGLVCEARMALTTYALFAVRRQLLAGRLRRINPAVFFAEQLTPLLRIAALRRVVCPERPAGHLPGGAAEEAAPAEPPQQWGAEGGREQALVRWKTARRESAVPHNPVLSCFACFRLLHQRISFCPASLPAASHPFH